MDYKVKLTVNYQDRIDKYIADNSEISRSDVKKLVEKNSIFVHGIQVRKPNFIVRETNEILVTEIIQKEINAKPENIKIDIVYEDDDIIVINKDSGMVVHPAPGHPGGTLVNALLYKFNNLSNVNGNVRPGIVHRIDKDTSGLLVVAKNNEAHNILAQELKQHKIKRTYYALVEGRMENEIYHLKLPIGRDPKHRQRMTVTKLNSKEATTNVFTEKVFKNTSLVRCELETGRTHQIRVHMKYIKHPIVGDPLYGNKKDEYGQRLHASKLELVHPTTKKLMTFEVPLPKFFEIDKQ